MFVFFPVYFVIHSSNILILIHTHVRTVRTYVYIIVAFPGENSSFVYSICKQV